MTAPADTLKRGDAVRCLFGPREHRDGEVLEVVNFQGNRYVWVRLGPAWVHRVEFENCLRLPQHEVRA